MRILHRYVLVDYLVIFLMTLSVLTFVMCIGVVIKAIDIAARGVSGGLVAQIFLLNIPYMLMFTIPISILTASLLLFGRLSFDGELTAMRACGMSLWNIISPIVIASVIFSVVCIFINTSLAPRCKELARGVLQEIGMEQPASLLEPGRFIQDFPNMQIYIGSRDGNQIRDVVVYETDSRGSLRNIRAERGVLRPDDAAKKLYVDLYNAKVEQTDGAATNDPTKSKYINASYYPAVIDLSSFAQKSKRKKPSDMNMTELIDKIEDVKKAFPDFDARDLSRWKMFMVVEVNKRFAMAFSCFAFALIGIPLGMKSRRKESSVGLGIALGLLALFYLFMVIADGLVKRPEWRPDLVIWLPVILFEIIGFILIYRQK
jgi:lipopolysaccharide export system permease protein